jgi:rhodanese-related sulfurtransferase
VGPEPRYSKPSLTGSRLNALDRRKFLLRSFTGFSLAIVGNAQAQMAWLFRAPKDFAEVYQVIAEKFPGVPNLSTSELATLFAKGEPPLLLDYRSRAEFEVSHLPGALFVANLNAARMEIAKVRAIDSQRKVLVYCSVGYRSAELVAQIQSLPDRGFGQALYNLKGSLFLWANEGRPFVKARGPGPAEQPAQLVHPYNNSWAALLAPQLRAPI